MANIVPVARVSAVQGQAFAKNEKGELRPLHVGGDGIYEGDVLVTGADTLNWQRRITATSICRRTKP